MFCYMNRHWCVSLYLLQSCFSKSSCVFFQTQFALTIYGTLALQLLIVVVLLITDEWHSYLQSWKLFVAYPQWNNWNRVRLAVSQGSLAFTKESAPVHIVASNSTSGSCLPANYIGGPVSARKFTKLWTWCRTSQITNNLMENSTPHFLWIFFLQSHN